MENSADRVDLENCSACGCSMDVSTQSPYGHVVCPKCSTAVHVKCDVGGYKITSQHGIGGMSLVFAAVDMTLGRKAAIKLLNENYSSDEKRIAEFEKEAKITASISHPNVVRVYTVGKAFGRYFIAMELVEGKSLEQLMFAEGAQDEKKMTRLAIEIVDGLNAAHKKGLIHRDMKPGNVLLDLKGHAKIVDFGLALVTQGGTAVADEIWATPYYVPPETLQMKEEDLRSDIYALGATLYHAVSGTEPFAPDVKSTSEYIKIKATIPKLGEIADTVSAPLCEVIDKMMGYLPEDRYQTYEELLVDLHKVKAFHSSGNVPDFDEPQVNGSNKKKLFIGLGIGIACLTIGAVVLTNSSEAPTVTENQSDEPVETVDLEVEDLSAKQAVFGAELRNAMNLFEQGKYSAAYQQYLKLTVDKNLEHETACWAGLQAAICAWISGEPQLATSALNEVLMIHEEESVEQSEVESKLLSAIDKLLQQKKFDVSAVDESTDEIDAMILMAAALKEWNQGRFNLAEKSFSRIVNIQLSAEHENVKTYNEIAAAYLHDRNLLKPFQGKLKLNSIADVEQMRGLLILLKGQFKTKGVIVERVQSLSKKLDARIEGYKQRAIDEKAHAERKQLIIEQKWSRAKSEAKIAYSQHLYAKVISELKPSQPLNAEDEAWKSKQLYVSETIQSLYAATFEALDGKSADFAIYSFDGENSYTRLLGASAAGLKVMGSNNKSMELKWREIAPQTIIDLHAKLKVSSLEPEVRRQRLEQLTIYAWRQGLTYKSDKWSKKLIEEAPEFAERWESLQQE